MEDLIVQSWHSFVFAQEYFTILDLGETSVDVPGLNPLGVISLSYGSLPAHQLWCCAHGRNSALCTSFSVGPPL
jgi:hypothetical protein